MSANRFDELLADHLEGALDAAGTAELAELVRNDDGLRRRLLDLAGMDGLLRAELAGPKMAEELVERISICLGEPDQDERTADAVLERIQGESILSRRHPRTFRRFARPGTSAPLGFAFAAAAAAAFFALILAESQTRPAPERVARTATPVAPEPEPPPSTAPRKAEAPPAPPPAAPLPPPAPRPLPPPPPPAPPAPEPAAPPRPTTTVAAIAELTSIEGEAELVRGDERLPAKAETALLEGDGLQLAPSGRAAFTYPDGTRVELRGGSAVVLTTAAGKRVALAQGQLTARVAKQPAKEPMAFTTPQGEARVLGTTLRLGVGAGTRLEVEEGKVCLTRSIDRKAVDVAGGYFAVAAPGVELVAQPIPMTLFADAFDRSPVGEWPQGWGRHPREAAQRSGFTVTQDVGGRFLAALPVGSGLTQHAYIPAAEWAEDVRITFRMRLSGVRNSRAGIELDDERTNPSVEVDATQGVLKIEWPRGTTVKQVPFRAEPGAWVKWDVALRGPRLAAQVEGAPLLELQIGARGTSMTPSLISRGADGAQYDDVKVVRLPGGSK